MTGRLKGKAPHADTDARRTPDPNRRNMPEGLRRERKGPYGPKTGYANEKAAPQEGRHARRRHVVGPDEK